MLLTILVLCVVLLCVITFWVPCCDVRYDVRIKNRCSVHLYFQLFVRAPIWRCLCLLAYSGIQISCCVFGLCLFSPCVPYVASFFGLSLFVLPLLYSLTFIYYEHDNMIKNHVYILPICFTVLYSTAVNIHGYILTWPLAYNVIYGNIYYVLLQRIFGLLNTIQNPLWLNLGHDHMLFSVWGDFLLLLLLQKVIWYENVDKHEIGNAVLNEKHVNKIIRKNYDQYVFLRLH